MRNEIYLDNSATTMLCKEALNKTVDVLENHYGNPSSLHKKGFEAEKIVLEAKKNIAAGLGCETDEIIFTSGATEANNLAVIGIANALKRRGNKIITTAIEHPSVLEAMKKLEQQGFEVCYVTPNKNGEITKEDILKLVDENTLLISMMLVNNETGLLLPVFDIAKSAKEVNPNVKIHIDAVQGFLKIPFKINKTQVDLLTISGHKIYAPKGIGVLYIKKGTRLLPQIFGGGQQNGIRPGTEPTALIAGLGAAVLANMQLIDDNFKKFLFLKEYFLDELSNIEQIKINSTDKCVPYIINISVGQIRSEVLLHFLEQLNIFVSSGSACSKGKKSHVLTAMGLENNRIDSAIRISFSNKTTTQELKTLVDALKLALTTLHTSA
ncbi:MAG: cysteine desulfurase family protein [Oscillospiraceae bacterium]